MTQRDRVPFDGNTAATHVAHAVSEVIAIYPITPSSVMGELADEKSAAGETNVWGAIPEVAELQSEAGAAAAVHGALASGALTTTFTASQGLLLMIPSMFKIAGELLPTVFHIAARSVACQALSIFGDHSDVMAARSTGFGLLASGSVQEVMDLACVAHAATLESRVPFLHFFDGFRTSHEINTISPLTKDEIASMIEDQYVIDHRRRGLSPDHPMISGSSQNPDVYFQGRETVNPYYLAAPAIVDKYMRKLEQITGRHYELFQYFGHPEAENVVILMGSGAEAVHETIDSQVAAGKKVGMIKVRLYRPFSPEHLAAALPASVKKVTVLDRTKEPGALGDPLYLDVVVGLAEAFNKGNAPFTKQPAIYAGRYGLSSKEFTPGMIKAVLDNMDQAEPRNHFTVGINDDVCGTSLVWDHTYRNPNAKAMQCMFYGLGADGTVGANKNSIKIIGKGLHMNAQAYFVYDSKKAGAVTVSHLRFGRDPILSTYLCDEAQFLGCHNFSFIERFDMLKHLKQGGTFLLNSPYSADEVWDKLPRQLQQQIIAKRVRFFVINAIDLAKQIGLGSRINIIMQTAFFKISGILPEEQALAMIRDAIEDTYGNKGPKVVQMNMKAAELTLENIHEIKVPADATSVIPMRKPVPDHAPQMVHDIVAPIILTEGDSIPVSKMPVDGKFITGTTQYEKRNIATEIPVWAPEHCIQCGQCSLICPHATIRMKIYDAGLLDGAPPTFKSSNAIGKQYSGKKFTLQVAPEDCTGCGLCVEVCPSKIKALKMETQYDLREPEAKNYTFFLELPDTDPSTFNKGTIKGSQLLPPMFEYSGACSGCGETPYVKLLTQLFGDRLLADNATGCSSIYGGNLPTTPYCTRKDGLGPAWTNSLFEDCAEVSLGFRLTVDKFTDDARRRLSQADVPAELKQAILDAEQTTDVQITEQRIRIAQLKELVAEKDPHLHSLADYLIRKSVWSIGGDGWAYDIGYGGLDHVIASGRNVNLLVLDTEVYSNTGGQMSKSTPRGATAKFAVAGKPVSKKDLALLATTYGSVYVARVALGANPARTVQAFMEADSYPGASIIIAYCHCIAHGIDMRKGLEQQKKAVDCGHWVTFRFDPRRIQQGLNPLQLDCKDPSLKLDEYIYNEIRYRALRMANPARAQMLLEAGQKDVTLRYNTYKQMAQLDYSIGQDTPAE